MLEPAAILERIDRAIAEQHRSLAELLELRAEVAAAALPPNLRAANGLDVDDLADANLLDTTSAQERFGYPRNTIAKWWRTEGVGVPCVNVLLAKPAPLAIVLGR